MVVQVPSVLVHPARATESFHRSCGDPTRALEFTRKWVLSLQDFSFSFMKYALGMGESQDRRGE